MGAMDRRLPRADAKQETGVSTMEQLDSYSLKSVSAGPFNFRPLLQRLAWAVNILLFSAVFWAYVFCLGRMN